MQTATTEMWELADALEDGRGSVDRSEERTLSVRGADARGWLGDLVTADVATLDPGGSRRSLLLTPTGRIRADLWITQVDDDAFVLVQARDEPEPVEDLLRPYVLSSAVRLDDTTGTLRVLVFPGRDEILTVARNDRDAWERATSTRGSVLVDEPSYELWRVSRGDPRMGVDFEAGALPAEAGLEHLIDIEQGMLPRPGVRGEGAEPRPSPDDPSPRAVARPSSLPAPPCRRGNEVVGHVTSAVPGRGGGSVIIAKVEWRALDAALQAPDASPLFPLPD